MTVRERILTIRLLERLERHPEYAEKLGVEAIITSDSANQNKPKERAGGLSMARKIRSDCTVGTLEKNYGLPAGTIRNKNGRDTRSDKKVGTIRREAERKGQ